ncbi:MAG TPA: polysaccharide pyruvyl transferase family protein, partial [Kiloniellaceae bacterium]
NFGDDVNPFLLERVFAKRLIASETVCIMGIGTIINDRNVAALDRYSTKIIFSSGAGYEELRNSLDSSWRVACVRGPKTAAMMKVDASKAVCDGAVLLSDYYDIVPAARRERVAFVPHVNTTWAIGRGLREICGELGLAYVSPDLPRDEFVREISRSDLVLTEAMHGAILADAMRTPWVCCHIMFHNRFKWEDWCASVGVAYDPVFLGPRFSDAALTSPAKLPHFLIGRLRRWRIKAHLKKLLASCDPQLSDEVVLAAKKHELRRLADDINQEFAA